MDSFKDFFFLGTDHVWSTQHFHHYLIVIALVSAYQLRHWKKMISVIFLLTLFNWIAYFLVDIDVIQPNVALVNFLLPVTILLIAILSMTKMGQNINHASRYVFAAVYGFFHGLGFLSFVHSTGFANHSWITSHIPFNLGFFLGQILIGLVMTALASFMFSIFNVKTKEWNIFTSGLITGLSIMLIIAHWPL